MERFAPAASARRLLALHASLRCTATTTTAALSGSLRPLGARVSAPRCTALGLGGVCWEEDDVAWMANVDAAFATGVRYFDTAPAYGTGLSEHRMGLALRKFPRGSYLLSTKVGYFLRPDQPGDVPTADIGATMPFRMDFDYTHDAVMRQFEDSLQRLGVARIDCLVIHGMDYSSESLDGVDSNLEALASGGMLALHELRASGAIQAIGLGVNEECPVVRKHHGGTAEQAALWNFNFVQRVLAMRTPLSNTDGDGGGGAAIDFLLLAGIHTLLNHTAYESGIMGLCAEQGVGVVMGAPFNSGILTSSMAENGTHAVWTAYS
jgi:D-threo-aldose 1-dehydrogenase